MSQSSETKSRAANRLRLWRAKNPGKVKAQRARQRSKRSKSAHAKYMADYRKRNPDKAKAVDARRRASGKPRAEALMRRYGISQKQFDAMLVAQSYCCAVCMAPSPGWKHGWAVDHNHNTGEVRGLLCHNCNVAIGHAKENIVTLRAMIRYLGGNNEVD